MNEKNKGTGALIVLIILLLLLLGGLITWALIGDANRKKDEYWRTRMELQKDNYEQMLKVLENDLRECGKEPQKIDCCVIPIIKETKIYKTKFIFTPFHY